MNGNLDDKSYADLQLRLLLDCGASAREWMKFYFALQTSLLAGCAASAGFSLAQFKLLGLLAGGVLIAAAALGVVFGRAIVQIVRREHQWQGWYAESLNAVTLGSRRLHVFPDASFPSDEISSRRAGFIGDRIIILNVWLSGAWLVIAAVGVSLAFWPIVLSAAPASTLAPPPVSTATP